MAQSVVALNLYLIVPKIVVGLAGSGISLMFQMIEPLPPESGLKTAEFTAGAGV